MKIDAPCPECGSNPVTVLNMLDGRVWICNACGYQELERTQPTPDTALLIEALDEQAKDEAMKEAS